LSRCSACPSCPHGLRRNGDRPQLGGRERQLRRHPDLQGDRARPGLQGTPPPDGDPRRQLGHRRLRDLQRAGLLRPRTGKEQKRIKNISDPYQLGFSPDNKWFVANSLRLDRVDLYKAADFSLVARIPAAKRPPTWPSTRPAASSSSRCRTPTKSSPSTSRPASRLEAAGRPDPAGIHMTPDDKHLLVGIMGANYVEVIDWRARKTVKKIITDKAAHNFLPKGDGRHVFVSNRSVKGSISLVDMQTLTEIEKYDVPGGPDDMEIRADGKELWATARFARKVQVVNLEQKKLSHSIPVGRSPHGVSFISHAPRL
jgi:hypothetical protein